MVTAAELARKSGFREAVPCRGSRRDFRHGAAAAS
jgi:hypothetical protein